MGPSRRCWNGATSALQPEEIPSKGTRVSCVYYQQKCPYEKSLETYLMILVLIFSCWKIALSNGVVESPAFVVVSLEIKWNHYFFLIILFQVTTLFLVGSKLLIAFQGLFWEINTYIAFLTLLSQRSGWSLFQPSFWAVVRHEKGYANRNLVNYLRRIWNVN